MAGYVELDLVSLGTSLWPSMVVLVAVGLTAIRFSPARVALGLLALAALAIGALAPETLQNGLGALADGPSPNSVLGGWWWVTGRGRLVG